MKASAKYERERERAFINIWFSSLPKSLFNRQRKTFSRNAVIFTWKFLQFMPFLFSFFSLTSSSIRHSASTTFSNRHKLFKAYVCFVTFRSHGERLSRARTADYKINANFCIKNAFSEQRWFLPFSTKAFCQMENLCTLYGKFNVITFNSFRIVLLLRLPLLNDTSLNK